MTVFTLPSGYSRIKRVRSFEELVTTRFEGGVNALCWERTLTGNFSAVVEQLGLADGTTTLDDTRLLALSASPACADAIGRLLEDQRLLRTQGLAPVVDVIHRYPRDESSAVVSTDVYSFHADRATVEADTYLCTYHGLPSEGLRNDEARRHVDIPETRAELLKLFGGDDDEDFQEFLKENCYDLHYAPLTSAQPFSFGLGNFWRIAVDYPRSPVPPCIHRAPENRPGQSPRLLLIS